LRGKRVVGVACGVAHCLAYTDQNEVYSWGVSLYGKLGNLDAHLVSDPSNNNPYQPNPQIIKELIDIGQVHAVACGHHSSFIIAKVGTTITQDLEKLLGTSQFSDVTFILEGNRQLKLHKCILASRSEYFANLFTHQMKEQSMDNPIIDIHDCHYFEFAEMVKWVYTDTITRGLSLPDLIDLLGVADRFRVVKLKYQVAEQLKPHIQIETVLDILKASDMFQAPQLGSSCLSFISHNYEQVRSFTNCFDELLRSTRYAHLVKKLLCGINTKAEPRAKKQKT
jgi:hypothetical protein